MKNRLLSLTILFFLYSILTINSSGSYFIATGNSKTNSATAGCWVPPIAPSLSSPANNTNTNANDVNFNWLATTSTCPIATISYSFQLDNVNDFTSPLINTPFSGNLGYAYNNIPQGEYWWRVQAKDQFDDTSTSSVYHLIVDRVAPIPSLSISGSWTKVVNEKITNGGFETGNLNGWTTAGNVEILNSDTISNPATTITPPDGSWMVRIGNPADPGNYVWENRLMQSFDGWPKSFSLSYNFFSRDYNDQPGFFIRINGQEVFKLNNLGSDGITALNTNWQQFYYDLSNHTDSKINLSLYAGNTGDTLSQSWVYVDKITTYFVAAPTLANYQIWSGDPFPGSGTDYCRFKIDANDWQTGYNFSIPTPGPHTLQYYCVDRAGNSSPTFQVNVITDGTAPSDISDLSVLSTTANSATLTWTAPGNDGGLGRASQYDVRYSSTLTDCSGFNFATAAKVEKVPSPQDAGKTETLEVLGLNPAAKYCFALKTADEAPNWSALSNIASTTTLSGLTVNAGDIVINELMWMGSNTDSGDEWIEIRNLTDREIDLSGFTLERPGSPDIIMFTFPAGAKLKPKNDLNKDDYLVVAEFDKEHSSLKNDPDYIVGTGIDNDSNFDLSDTTLQIYLYDNSSPSNLIDQAWNNSAPKEGFYAAGSKFYSMERTSIPGDGTKLLNWYTCIDADSSALYFDGGADERGTPGAANRSENEPLAHQSLIFRAPSPTPLPTVTPQPEISLNISNDNKKLSFTVKNLTNYIKLSYELTYDSDIGPQGVIGETDLENQDEYKKENITLGTCSTNGNCVYHTGVKNIKLKIDLEDKNHNTYSKTQLID